MTSMSTNVGELSETSLLLSGQLGEGGSFREIGRSSEAEAPFLTNSNERSLPLRQQLRYHFHNAKDKAPYYIPFVTWCPNYKWFVICLLFFFFFFFVCCLLLLVLGWRDSLKMKRCAR